MNNGLMCRGQLRIPCYACNQNSTLRREKAELLPEQAGRLLIGEWKKLLCLPVPQFPVFIVSEACTRWNLRGVGKQKHNGNF